MITYRTPVLEEWVDYNGHLRDAFYLLIFSYATDAFMAAVSVDPEQDNHSMFTLECHLNFLHEVKRDAQLTVHTSIVGHDDKRLHIYHTLHVTGVETPVAASEQMLLHVALDGPKSAPLSAATRTHVQHILAEQVGNPRPTHIGRIIALPHTSASRPI